MSQQAGRIGTRGPGETAKEKEQQHIERRMNKLRKELEQLARPAKPNASSDLQPAFLGCV